MTDVIDFLPIFNETLARVRARMDADANAGVLADDPAWIDTREGSFYWDMTQVAALEITRLWDALAAETVAAAFPSVAWGDYLDEHAATFGLVRNPAVPAQGTVMFNGDAGVLIATGTQVSAPPSDPSLDAIAFKTLTDGVTAAALAAPANVVATPATTGGTLPAATYIYRVTAYNEYGETLAGADTPAVVTTATGEVALTWDPVLTAIGYRVYRTLSSLTLGLLISDQNATAFTDTGVETPGAPQPTENTTSGVILNIIAITEGSAGNLPAGAVTELDTLLPGIRSVTSIAETSGGADVEDDEALRRRVLAQYQGQGVGTRNWYVSQILAIAGVERGVCIPVATGPGTVLVILMLSDGSPVTDDVVATAQAVLDPLPGLGHGLAPIGHTVTVATTTALAVDIAAALTFGTGFSLDGSSGTIATRTEIEAAITAYVTALNPGDTIVFEHVVAAIFSVDGVAGVNATVNGDVLDVPLGLTPPEYPALSTPALT